MSSKPLSDDEVAAEMKKMVAFIKQEALEKAREIKVKADEEFSIEKGKIVRQETANIDALYQKKRKQVEIQKRITRSNQTNSARLKLLQIREELLEDVFEQAKKGLSTLTQDHSSYADIVHKLTLQALFTLMERDVKVLVREEDMHVAEGAVDKAVDIFKERSGIDCRFELKNQMASDLSGGCIVLGHGSRIKVDNSLDERMALLEDRMLPEIRIDLFGANENRKFHA